MDPAEMSRDEKIAAAIRYRARGHSLRFIGDKLDTAFRHVKEWLDTPEAQHEIAQVVRDELPDLADDGDLARQLLRDQVNDADAEEPLRQKAAAVLLANQSRAIEVAAKAKEADAATSLAVTAEGLAQLEAEAQAHLVEINKRKD